MLTSETHLTFIIDGTLGNNTPTVAEIEARANRGAVIPFSELNSAIKAEQATAQRSEQPAEQHTEQKRANTPKLSIRELLKAGKEQIARERFATR